MTTLITKINPGKKAQWSKFWAAQADQEITPFWTPSVETKEVRASKTVLWTLPDGTKETAQYFITPSVDGKPRWVEKKRCISISRDNQITVELPEREVRDRKVKLA